MAAFSVKVFVIYFIYLPLYCAAIIGLFWIIHFLKGNSNK